MSFNSTSPTNYGFEGDPLLEAYMNAKFSEEISEKMKVPKRIGFQNNQEMEIENHEILNGNQMNSWNYYEKLDMTVPDRIVVIGQDQHLGELQCLFALWSFTFVTRLLLCFALFTFSSKWTRFERREKFFFLDHRD
jgi:Mitochondrial and peroxisomal fission factor Mff